MARGDGRGLQATTLAHRVLRLLGRGPDVGVEALGPVPHPGAAGRASGMLPIAHVPAPRGEQDDTAPAAPADPAAWAGDPALARILDRARSAGAPATTVHALAAAWPDLAPGERRGVDRPLGDGRPGPVRVGGAPARQTDGTTCGSAVLAMLAATGDPVLALWLATGRLLPGYLPPELRAMAGVHVTAPDAGARLSALQRALKRSSTHRALGPLPWPAALGTPPWGAARTARFPGVRWTHVLVDDTDPGLVDAVHDGADAALAAGIPVPLFSGGDLGGGPAAAVPRHVVLLVPAGPDATGYAVYEPGQGRVHRVSRDRLARPAGPHPALGGWSHVCWAVLPHPVAPAVRAA